MSPRFSDHNAVKPAMGSVDACAKETEGGNSARDEVGTATSSAHEPALRIPTTLAPTDGPEPSAAASSTVPARSHPGRYPASPCASPRTSPALSEAAATRTSACDGAGDGASTSRSARCPGAL